MSMEENIPSVHAEMSARQITLADRKKHRLCDAQYFLIIDMILCSFDESSRDKPDKEQTCARAKQQLETLFVLPGASFPLMISSNSGNDCSFIVILTAYSSCSRWLFASA